MMHGEIFKTILAALDHMDAALSHSASFTPLTLPHLEKMRESVGALRNQMAGAGDDHPMESRVKALEVGLADLHASLAEKGPVTVQRAVAEVEVPQPE